MLCLLPAGWRGEYLRDKQKMILGGAGGKEILGRWAGRDGKKEGAMHPLSSEVYLQYYLK
jgi:hypothetical protein